MSRSRDFSSSSLVVSNGDVAALDITNPMTISAWLNPDSLTSGAIVAKFTTGSGGGQYMLRVNSSRIGMWCLDAADTGAEGFSPATLRTGIWQAVAGRNKGPIGAGAMQGFLDGKTGASDDLPSSNPNNSQSVRIGLRGDLSEQLDGRVAHVGIWNAALTDEEILRLAQGKLPPQVRPENLAGYWPLDDYASSGATREFRWNNRMGVHAGTVAPRPGPPIPYLAPHIFLQNLKQPNFQGGQLTVPIEAV